MRVEIDTATVEAHRHAVLRVLDEVAEAVLVVVVLGELFAVTLNVLARLFLGFSFPAAAAIFGLPGLTLPGRMRHVFGLGVPHASQ